VLPQGILSVDIAVKNLSGIMGTKEQYFVVNHVIKPIRDTINELLGVFVEHVNERAIMNL
jgi:hypothetical protein